MPSEIVTLVRLLQLYNADAPIEVTLPGTVISFNEEQFEKTPSLITVSSSGRVMFKRAEQPPKAIIISVFSREKRSSEPIMFLWRRGKREKK